MASASAPRIRTGTIDDHPAVVALARVQLGGERQVHSRRQFVVTEAELLVAESGEASETVEGFAAWEVDGAWAEVLAIAAATPGEGVGAALLAEVERRAVASGCTAVRLVTTDDNPGAQRFYEREGYSLAERLVGAVDECRRRFKPEIPESAHDELRYERRLG